MGLADRLTQEFDLSVEWLPFEIHPETPAGGRPLLQLFPRADTESMTRRLNAMGAAFGIRFQKIERISNSRLSLEAGEFAKEQGRFDEFHRAVFEAYFTRREDIGDLGTLKQIGKAADLDPEALGKAIQAGTYRQMLERTKTEAAGLGISAAPTFVFNNKDRIVGAQPLEAFRELLMNRSPA